LSAIKVNRLQELASEGLNAYDGNIHWWQKHTELSQNYRELEMKYKNIKEELNALKLELIKNNK
jgi:branched-subunit amino acid aminotransferase/4-amino-4-deoxychorismate lyase